MNKKKQLIESLQYEVLRPSGNDTGIIFVDNISKLKGDPLLRKKLDSEIKSRNLNLEQVGFLDLSNLEKPTVMMAGLEFCGNFLRCCAYLIYLKTGRKNDKIQIKFILEKETLEINAGIDGLQSAWAEIPVENIQIKITPNYSQVELKGITHLVSLLPNTVETDDYIQLATEFLEENGLENLIQERAALGVMFVKKEAEQLVLYPIVWVKDQVYFETACGSGSAATMLALNKLDPKIQKVSLLQPSGQIIDTEVIFDQDKIKIIKIGGTTQRLTSGIIPRS